jgi:hypothetical protein
VPDVIDAHARQTEPAQPEREQHQLQPEHLETTRPIMPRQPE